MGVGVPGISPEYVEDRAFRLGVRVVTSGYEFSITARKSSDALCQCR